MNFETNVRLRGEVRQLAAGLETSIVDALGSTRVLVTGGNGLIGSWICATLLAVRDTHGIPVTVTAGVRNRAAIARLFPDAVASGSLILQPHDLLTPLPAGEHFDLIFHTAGQTTPDDFIRDPAGVLVTSFAGTQHILSHLASQEHGKLVFLSTREIYGHQIDGPRFLVESDYGIVDPLDPRSCYPEGKRAAEALITAHGRQHSVDSTIVRVSHTYGPGMRLLDGRVIGDFLGGAIRNRQISMNSDGSAELTLTYISDVIHGIFIAALVGTEPVYNVSQDAHVVSVCELADTIARLSGSAVERVEVPATEGGYLKHRPAFLDSAQLKAIGWQPVIDLDEGISRTLRAYAEEK